MRIVALIKRICTQMIRDKRTLALLLVAPLLIITLMYFLFNGNTVETKLGIVKIDANVEKILASSDIKLVKYDSVDKDKMISDKLDGMLQTDDKGMTLTLLNNDPSRSKTLEMKIGQAFSSFMQSSMGIKSPTIKTDYIFGSSETNFFDILSPVLVGFFVFFFVFLISGIGLLRERTTGTLERLMSTPIKRSEVITGYLIGYGIFAVIQTIIVVLFAINVLKITLVGSIWSVIFINLSLALVALSLGILLSTFAASEFQMMQFIPIVIIPQVFFAGIFPVDSMAGWMQVLGKAMPIYYGAEALKGVMYNGWTFGDYYKDVLILMVYTIVFIILNVIALKKYRKL